MEQIHLSLSFQVIKFHFVGNPGSDYGPVIKKKTNLFSCILAMRLALGAVRHMLKFVEPYWKKDVMV